MQVELSEGVTERVMWVRPIEVPRRRWFEKRHIMHLVGYDSGRVAVIYSWGNFHEELATADVLSSPSPQDSPTT